MYGILSSLLLHKIRILSLISKGLDIDFIISHLIHVNCDCSIKQENPIMRTIKCIPVVIILCLFSATGLQAQRNAQGYSLGVYGGASLLLKPGDFKDYYNMSIGVGGEFMYNFSEVTSLRMSVVYLPYSRDLDKDRDNIINIIREDMEDKFPGVSYSVETNVEGGNFAVNLIALDIVQYFTSAESMIGIYATAGIGYYWQRYSEQTKAFTVTLPDSSIQESGFYPVDSEGDFGFQGGGGVEVSITNKMLVFAEGKYHYALVQGENLSYVAVLGGIRFRFSD